MKFIKVFACFFLVLILFNCNKKTNRENFLEVAADSRTLNFDADAGYQTVTVSANVEFAAVSSHSEWCKVTVLNYATDNLGIAVSKNGTFDERGAKVTISATDMNDVDITIVQASSMPSLSVNRKNILIQGVKREFTLDIHANFPIAFELPGWISEKEGNFWLNGLKTYSFIASSISESIFSREGTIKVRAANASVDFQPVSISVLQEYSPPKPRASFMQPSLPALWDDDRWDQEFKTLKEVGMEYLIFSPTFRTQSDGTTWSAYPSELTANFGDLIDICLRNAQKNGFKVFIGLNYHQQGCSPFRDSPDVLYDYMEIGNRVADELIRKYKDRYGETMYGWYWVWEAENLSWNTPRRRQTLAHAMNINRDYLAAVTPSMPLMLSPYVNYRIGTASENRQLWEDIFSRVNFREGDIFAPQDCVGSGGLTVEMLPEWFSQMEIAVKTKPGLLFWANIESFTYLSHWMSATIDRYVKQIEQTQPFVSGMITFAYCHYYSPLYANPQFHDAYSYYCRYGILPTVAVPARAGNPVIESQNDQQTVLRWDAPPDRNGLLGYRIFKNDVRIGEMHYNRDGWCPNTFTDTNSGSGDIYAITTYNVVGMESPKIVFIKN